MARKKPTLTAVSGGSASDETGGPGRRFSKMPTYQAAMDAALLLSGLLADIREDEEVSAYLLSAARNEALSLEADCGERGGAVSALLQALYDRIESTENQTMVEDAAARILAFLRTLGGRAAEASHA
ncbi:MAG: hypothetical protein KJ011_05235 [Burkholderiaceae bacterium]|nr:hypothetical protein [Burkholderiaceae bacterium]